MSRELEYDGYWEGKIEYRCDNCQKKESFLFSDEEGAKNYRQERKILRDEHGWIFTQIEGIWHDFCCESCKNAYIRKNTI